MQILIQQVWCVSISNDLPCDDDAVYRTLNSKY